MLIQALTNSFRAEILQGVHDLDTDTLKLALYTGSASLNPTTTVYTTTDEVVASGYPAGGVILTGVTINTSTASTVQPSIVYVNFDNALFTAALTARGGLIYNSSKADKSIAVLDFGADKTSTTTFTVQMPPNTSTAALLRFN
jgi:hypothetical protein